LESGSSPAYNGAGPVIVGAALVMRGFAGGVVGVAPESAVLPDAAICGLCANVTPRVASVSTAPQPAVATHTLNFADISIFGASDLSGS
jgi:hypothetical protein